VSTKDKLGPYLAGLIEGDGYIYVPLERRNSKGKKIFPHIEIASDIKESNFDIMSKIAENVKSSVKFIKRNRLKYIEKGYLVRTDKRISKDILFSYLYKIKILYLGINAIYD